MQNAKNVAAATSPVTQNVAPVLQKYLETVQRAVAAVPNPDGHGPVEIPDYAILLQAAGHLDSPSATAPGEKIFMISSLLGRARSVDMHYPTLAYPLKFPHDHHLHADMGLEWYWVGAHMNVTDQQGRQGRLSILLSTQKIRSIGLQAQKDAEWSDEQVMVADNVVTITVDMPDNKAIYRRSPNHQWPAKGGSLSYSTPGESFYFQCGPDSLSGSPDVLPLSVAVNDGDNMVIDIRLNHNSSLVDAESAFFLQGVPNLFDSTGNGTGITTVPTPGIYYSWPQLLVEGSVTVGGNIYSVGAGSTAWIDHQLMMSSLDNSGGAAKPVPFVNDPTPYNGWVWQFYNLNDGRAFTGAGFVLGEMNYTPPMGYGYFVSPNKQRGWNARFITGDMTLTDPQPFPSIVAQPDDSTTVTIPISRSYAQIVTPLGSAPALSGDARPWYRDGTFNNPNGSLCGEFPADFTDTSGQYANGVGYLETVGFQAVGDWRAYMLGVLQGEILLDQ